MNAETEKKTAVAPSALTDVLSAKCCEHGFIGMDASFIHDPEVGAHPIVTVRFALDDWKSRDAFIEYFRHGG